MQRGKNTLVRTYIAEGIAYGLRLSYPCALSIDNGDELLYFAPKVLNDLLHRICGRCDEDVIECGRARRDPSGPVLDPSIEVKDHRA